MSNYSFEYLPNSIIGTAFQDQAVKASKLIPNVKSSFNGAILNKHGDFGTGERACQRGMRLSCLQMNRNTCSVAALVSNAVL